MEAPGCIFCNDDIWEDRSQWSSVHSRCPDVCKYCYAAMTSTKYFDQAIQVVKDACLEDKDFMNQEFIVKRRERNK